MKKRIGLAVAAAVLPLAAMVPAQAQPAVGTDVIRQLSTHCTDGHCRQREVRVTQMLPGSVGVFWRHRDWVPPILAPVGGYSEWSKWEFHRLAS